MPVLARARVAATASTTGHAVDRACLALTRATGHCVLAVAPARGDVVSLGRFHQRPAGDEARGVALARRTSGGRACAFGDGFLRLVLAQPHRSALVGDDPATLAPEQVLNRAVRGPMAALERLGIPVHYPGRDLLTVAGRPLAVLGLAVEDDGATLVDVVLSGTRDAALLPGLLDRADPTGVVRADMLLPDAVTSLARLGCDVAPDDLAAAAARGYADRLGVTPGDTHDVTPSDMDATWETARRPDPRHTMHATARTAIGVLEAHAARAADGTVADLRLAGDLLASTRVVAALEGHLRGVPLERGAVTAAVARALGASDGVLLGVGPELLVEAIVGLVS